MLPLSLNPFAPLPLFYRLPLPNPPPPLPRQVLQWPGAVRRVGVLRRIQPHRHRGAVGGGAAGEGWGGDGRRSGWRGYGEVI